MYSRNVYFQYPPLFLNLKKYKIILNNCLNRLNRLKHSIPLYSVIFKLIVFKKLIKVITIQTKLIFPIEKREKKKFQG